VCEADLGTEPDTQKEDAEAYRRVCEALRPYWLQQESMPAEEAVRRLVADTAKLVAENERLRIWQKAYAKGRAGLVEQADQDFACAEKAEADTAKLVEALRYLIERIDREFASSDRAPELDFVVMAANEVRHLAGFSVDAGKEQ
jgi:hypothetical protein